MKNLNHYTIILLVSLAIPLFFAECSEKQNKEKEAEKVLVGVIRWDGWVGDKGSWQIGPILERTMGPEHFHFRAPFYSEVTGKNSISMDGTSQEIMDREIAYAREAGIDYWAYCYYPDGCGLELARKNHQTSQYANDINWCAILGGSFEFDSVNDYSRSLVDDFARENYQKVMEGRPLIYLLHGTNFTRAGLDRLRELSITKGLKTPYVVIMEWNADSASAVCERLGADAVSCYATTGKDNLPFAEVMPAKSRALWEEFSLKKNVVPWICTGWNCRPRMESENPWMKYYSDSTNCLDASPEDIKNSLISGIKWVQDHREKAVANTVLVYAWNEFDEGYGAVCPTLGKDGEPVLDRLHAVKEAIDETSGDLEIPPQDIDVVAYYWPAYHVEPRFEELGIFREGKGEWEVIYNSIPKFEGHDQPLVPLWGYEDESNPDVAAKKIEAAVSHGVNVWAVDWYWYDGRPFLQGFLDKGLLKAQNKDKIRFYLMWANHDMNGYLDQTQHKKDSILMYAAVDMQEFDRISDYFIGYFHEPNYYKIDGKPVFSLYLLDAFIQGIGGVENAKAALEMFRKKTVAAGFPGLHLQAIIHEWVPDQLEGMESVNTQDKVLQYFGFNSITNYQWIHFMEIGSREDYTAYSKEAVKQFAKYDSDFTLPYFPHVSVGWDCNDRFPPEDPDPTVAPKPLYPNIMDKGIQPTVVNRSPEAFKEALQKARLYLENHPDQPRIISINSWNEWSEGSYLEPDTKRGYKYLEAVKEVVNLH